MKKLFLSILIVASGQVLSQKGGLKAQKSMLSEMKTGDSLLFYQCHVEEATGNITTASGQTLSTAPQKYSITEKFIIHRDSASYRATYYVSSMTILPNRRFSGLKIREREYWNFKKEKDFTLSDTALKVLTAIEKKGKEPTEYDFAITKSNTNQVIIKQGKNFKQLVIESDHVISKLIGD